MCASGRAPLGQRVAGLGRLHQATTPCAVADGVVPDLIWELVWSLQVAAA
jgi:hypothetical protein